MGGKGNRSQARPSNRPAGEFASKPAPRPEIELPAAGEPLPAPVSFIEALADLGVVLEPAELAKLGVYLRLLLDTNERMNLTAVTNAEEAWSRHLADALTLIPLLAEAPEGATVIDVGSGGGLPGIPLAIAMPHLLFSLVEPTGKKAQFLEHCVRSLDLANARVLRERAERLGQDRGRPIDRDGTRTREDGHRGAYDFAMCRAVGRLPIVLELLVPLVKVGGLCLFVKGQQADAEIAEAKKTLHLLHAAHAGTVDTPSGRIIVIEKLRDTPHAYPRPDGEPKRQPLGISAKPDKPERTGTPEGPRG